MGLSDRLRRLDDNALSDFTYDQYTAPFTWWLLTACGLLVLVSGLVQRDGEVVAVGVGTTVLGVALSILSRRRDRRVDNARRTETDRRMAERRARRQGQQER